MQAFDAIFPTLAHRESAVVHATDERGKPMGELVFREVFCDVPYCDCRWVMLQVEWLDTGEIAATIAYDFEKQRGQPQLRLDLECEQSPIANEILAMFAGLVRAAGYRKLLHAHHALWKRAVDDPAHPEHAKILGKPRRKPAKRKKPATKHRPSTVEAAPAGAQGLQRLVASATRTDSKVQQRFARLIKKVDQQKQQLRTWQDAKPAIAGELASIDALYATQRQVGRDLVVLFDRVHADPIFAKPERKRLVGMLCDLARELLVAEPHDELKAIYNRHSRGDFDDEQARDKAASARGLKEELEDRFGFDLRAADASSVETLEAHVAEMLRGMEQQAEATAEANARRKRTPRQAAKELHRETEAHQAGKALQEIYRKLAVALHPDRERDPAEQARKTELMQQVNVAYEAKDLLKLLELQLRFEQVDPDRLDAIAEERLVRYNAILDEQSKQLADELLELELPFRLELERPPPARIAPDMVLAKLHADTREITKRIAGLRRELADFSNLGRLKSWLRSQLKPRNRAWEAEGPYG